LRIEDRGWKIEDAILDPRSSILYCADVLTPEIESQIATLAARYGEPRRVDATLQGAPFDPLTMTDRFGEVCMVIQRPGGTLLTAIKTFYPPGAYRLLTGGVRHGEQIEAALLREIEEETGLDVEIRRFLAAIEYHLDRESGMGDRDLPTPIPHPPSPIPSAFVTFAFLLDEVGGTLGARDPEERIASFREIEVGELPALAATLDSIDKGFDPEIGGSWSDWGRFRAVVHRVVYEALTS
jgi:ADP-ribose pyrophosphatase YjhB (NUDIX family)